MISIEELADILDQVDIPVAYSHFNVTPNNPMPQPPFMVYFEQDSSNFGADNKVWKKILDYRIEVYTDMKDLELEKKIEDIFDEHNVYYETIESYISSQSLYQKIYDITIKKWKKWR